MWFAIALLAWPLVEIALFVVVGGAIGLWATLGIVLGTGFLGAFILRQTAAMTRGSVRFREPRQMLATATRGGMTLLAGILLILPGFLTDALGLLLLIPPVQGLVTALLARRIQMATASATRPRAQDDVIEGDYVPVDPPAAGQKPSRWTQD